MTYGQQGTKGVAFWILLAFWSLVGDRNAENWHVFLSTTADRFWKASGCQNGTAPQRDSAVFFSEVEHVQKF